MLNKQEVFNTVYTKLRAQGKRSIVLERKHQRCVYRGRGNTRCAIGHLIPDELYTKELEGQVVGRLCYDPEKVNINVVLATLFGELTKQDYSFLNALQQAHDYWTKETLDALDAAFREVAKQFDLEFNDA